MKWKKFASVALCAALLLPSLAFMSGCGGNETVVLRVFNWEEYIDVGGEGSYGDDYLGLGKNAPSVIDDFEDWYEETYQTPIRVEYSTFGTNEDMYNQLKLGVTFDLVCPSDYMIMKLAAEGMLEPLGEEFFDKSDEHNYYVNNVSAYIQGDKENPGVFDRGTLTVDGEPVSWSDYAAGYMWGTTGFIYNPEKVNFNENATFWDTLLNPDYKNKVTAKDNVRDCYFVGLAIAYQDELLALKERFNSGELTPDEYNGEVTEIMNRTDEETLKKVQKTLVNMKSNLYGFETDSGKQDMVTGKIWINFAWSGDAVYAMDLAEEEGVELNYYVPDECANLFFDGWVMPKGANKEAAQRFINFLSKPENAVRNMYYIGYTSVIAGDEVFAYIEDTYGTDGEEESVPYDLSYFFGENAVINTSSDQLFRQLYAQYPPAEVTPRCAVMDYYGDADREINELWTKVKGETLDGWAIAVICIAVVIIVGAILLSKFGGKIDFFRTKPKKGYELIKQEPYQPKNREEK